MAYKVGDQPVEGYKLETLLGTGTLGDTWKATAPDGGACVLKFINLSGISPREMRFPRAMLALRHPNLCPILGAWILDHNGQMMTDGASESINIQGKMNARLVIATGYGQKTLQQRLEECRSRGGVPLKDLMNYMADAARGLDYLHNPGEGLTGHVHGNIKPANLLVAGGIVQVCDYGLSRLDMSKGATRTFSAGIPLYNSPESLNDEIHKASDQYSLAIVYYELRTAQLPFEESKALISNLTGVLDFGLIGDAEQKVLERATNKMPGKRFSTCSEMVAALRKVVESTAQWSREISGEGSGTKLAPATPPKPKPAPPPPDRPTGSFSEEVLPSSKPTPVSPPRKPEAAPGSGSSVRKPSAAAPVALPSAAPPPPPARLPQQPSTKAAGASVWAETPADGMPKMRSRSGSPHQVEGQATVRYYSQMNPDRLYPFLVVFSERQIKEIVENSVKQAVSTTISVDEGSMLEVEPILPGCEVYPPLAAIQVTKEKNNNGWKVSTSDSEPAIQPARFYVLPKLLGTVEDARVVIRQDGVQLAEVPLEIVVRRQRWAAFMGLFGLVSPYAMMGLKAMNANPKNQERLNFELYHQANTWIVNHVQPLYVVITCLVLAVLIYLWCRPRRQTAFWDVEKSYN